MAVRLTQPEERMLSGDEGPLRRVAMEKIVRYAEILGPRSSAGDAQRAKLGLGGRS